MEHTDLKIKQQLFNYLAKYITDNKKRKFEEYIAHRTKYLTVVLEDIFQPHNASAVLRTCDCFGIQDIHIIENRNKYTLNPDVALGASKWINLIKYNKEENNTGYCIEQLRKSGYRIIATTPYKDSTMLEDLSLTGKMALLFGTELEGLSNLAIELADEYVKIPMYGFTESLNISVSAAIALFHLSEKLRRSNVKWQLTEEEIIDTKLKWARSVVKKAGLLEMDFLNKLT